MPELPEVETVRRVLSGRLKGLTITALEPVRPTFYRPPPQSALKNAAGRRIEDIGRRGKYLLLRLSGGKDLILHLGMSGRVVLGGDGTHLRFRLKAGNEVLNFHDSRRFGRVGCSLPRLGPEPLGPDFTADYLRRMTRKRRAPVKTLLMDQGIVAGIGNIYATEALFKAGIRPARAAASLSIEEVRRLHRAIREVLALAVKLGGSTLKDESYLDPLGRPGKFQEYVAVYGRKIGACGHSLKKTRRLLAGRTSLYCPACQA